MTNAHVSGPAPPPPPQDWGETKDTGSSSGSAPDAKRSKKGKEPEKRPSLPVPRLADAPPLTPTAAESSPSSAPQKTVKLKLTEPKPPTHPLGFFPLPEFVPPPLAPPPPTNPPPAPPVPLQLGTRGKTPRNVPPPPLSDPAAGERRKARLAEYHALVEEARKAPPPPDSSDDEWDEVQRILNEELDKTDAEAASSKGKKPEERSSLPAAPPISAPSIAQPAPVTEPITPAAPPTEPITLTAASVSAPFVMPPMQEAGPVAPVTFPAPAPFIPQYEAATPFAPALPRVLAQYKSSAPLAAQFPAPALNVSLSPVGYIGGTYADELILRQLAHEKPGAWEVVLGLYFQADWVSNPYFLAKQQGTALCNGWIRNWRRADILAANPADKTVERYEEPTGERDRAMLLEIYSRMEALEDAILWWAKQDTSGQHVDRVLRKAGWMLESEMCYTEERKKMQEIFTMRESDEQRNLLKQAEKESPRLYDYCVNKDFFCSAHTIKRKFQEISDDPKSPPKTVEKEVKVCYRSYGRDEQVIEPSSPEKNMAGGRPMQVHAVPLEERAFDSKGNRLPWALEWPDDHPNARGQKKRRVEEKGPFGKANRRKGSSRTRTVTPAKKENPTLDSFGRALFYDQQRRPYSPPNRASNDTNNSPNVSSADKQPTQVVLSGYQPDFQWQAISKYEKISRGMICEDYEREPPIEYHRYPNAISQSPYRRPRPLTKEERGMVNRFAGGENWIKVTFDSMVAAELAMMKSPIQVNQHWVYAQPYQGFGPVVDQPIPMSEEERIALNPSEKSIQLSKLAQPLALEQQQEVGSSMSNNVSSGNSMGTQTSDLRNRNISHTQEQTHNPQMMRFFPDTPRTILRPAHEALLPQPSWWERQVAWLTERGLIPAEIIGNGPRTLENGDFDWQNSSFYWKFWYLFDRAFETDMCGLRPEEGEEDL